jgi:hypothetical protein
MGTRGNNYSLRAASQFVVPQDWGFPHPTEELTVEFRRDLWYDDSA